MNRIISLSIEDMYIKYAGEAFGATGSHNALTLRMAFGPAWDGMAKTAYFTDALGSASVSVILGLDRLLDGAYEVDVPSEALKYAGEATVTIKGVLTSGDTTTKVMTTAAGHFRVLDSELPESAGNAGTITASDKEQLQAEIAGLEPMFTAYKQAAETAAANAKASEAAAAESVEQAKAVSQAVSEQVSTAKKQAENAETAANLANAAWMGLKKTEVDAVTVPSGSEAAAIKTQIGDHFHIRFEIPRGEQGKTGPEGKQGKPGPEGPAGPAGRDAAVVEAAGQYAFHVNEAGHLILTYTGDAAPNFSINDAGHLILNL